MIVSVLFFLLISLGLGSICYWAGFSKENSFEKLILSLGVGISLIPITGALFNLLKIPLDFRFFLSLALILLGLTIFFWIKRGKNKASLQLTPIISCQDLAVLVIFSASLLMYLKGSLSFPWLGSDDPYRFLSAAKYIATEKTYTTIFQFNVTTQPYPQGYQTLIAILSQINQSLNWTAKFFTSLLVSLSLLFFYCLANKLLTNKTAALLSTAALASMPAWLTHYLYPLNFNMALLPLFIYSLEKTSKNRKWIVISALIFASIWCIHFYSAFIITLLAATYYLAKIFCQNNLQKRIIASIVLGLFFSLFFWVPSCFIQFPGQLPGGAGKVVGLFSKLTQTKLSTTIIFLFSATLIGFLTTSKFWIPRLTSFIRKHKLKYTKQIFFYLAATMLLGLLLISEKMMPVLGSGSTPYSWRHFFALRLESNLIQSPFGIGPVSFALSIIAFFYLIVKTPRLFTRSFTNQTIIFIFAAFSFLGIISGRFSINLMPFRMWAFFAFSAALLNGVSYNQLIHKKIKQKWLKAMIASIVIISFTPSWYLNKYRLNTNTWQDNFLHVIQSQTFYGWLKDNLPKNSKVYSLGVSQTIPIAFDMLSFVWDQEIKNYKNKDVEATPENNYQFLKEKGYEYLAIDYPSVFSYTFKRSNLYKNKPEKIRKNKSLKRAQLAMIKKEILAKSDKFKLVRDFKHAAIFKLK
jgi:hypothetical protein